MRMLAKYLNRGLSGIFAFTLFLSAFMILSAPLLAQKRKAPPRKAAAAKKKAPIAKAAPLNLTDIKQIDDAGLKALLKSNGKPLIVNFWATWCGPCVEEFPEIVKMDEDYKGKADFLTISLDDPADIAEAGKFLKKMKAQMPSYLIKSADEENLIWEINKDWQGGLPFTLVYNLEGKVAYSIQGRLKNELLRKEIDKLLPIASK